MGDETLEESHALQQGSRGQEASSEQLLMGDEAAHLAVTPTAEPLEQQTDRHLLLSA